MHSLFATIAALLLFTPALSAPVRPGPDPKEDACFHVQFSSLELNKIARVVSLKVPQALNVSKVEADSPLQLLTMEAKDKCDPGSLMNDAVPCIQKMLDALKSYRSAMETVRQIQRCEGFTDQVRPAVDKLQQDMEKCVRWKTGMGHQEEETKTSAQTKTHLQRWEEDIVCHYTMDRLFSFSVLTARVFARGDPANHKMGAGATCRAANQASL